MRVTVLGAGYMGSAMAKVAASRGHDVTLWGTWLDDAMLDPVARGGVHPKLGLPLSELRVLRADALAEALEGAELVVHGVSSEGAVPVMTKARAHLPDVPIVSVTKGFLELTGTKKMDRVDVAVAEAVGRPVRWVHASGPAKAKEIARRMQCGSVWINKHGAIQPNAPFGGVKASGFGVEFGEEGLAEYTDIQVMFS